MKTILELRVIDLGERVLVVQVLSGLDNVPKFTNGLLDQTVHQFVTCGSSVNDLKRELAKHLDKLNAEGEYRFLQIRGDLWRVVDRNGLSMHLHSYPSESEAQAECDRLNGKQLPRLERDEDGVMTLYFIGQDGNEGVWIRDTVLEAFEQIAGTPFHIHEPKKRYKGEWQQLLPLQHEKTNGGTDRWGLGYNQAVENIEYQLDALEIWTYTVTEE